MSQNPSLRLRDTVVIGCSAGGVEALPRIIHQLPHDLPAAVFIVQHMAPTGTPYLVDILRRSSTLPVAWAEQGERIAPSRIYVAPPDTHLLFTDDHIALSGGARENHARPSIDKLFRAAAATFGNRTIGVLLTGMLADGVAGLRAIRDSGGIVIVQDPEDAAFPDLPSRALLAVTPDRTLPIDTIAMAIVSFVGGELAVHDVPRAIALEAALDRKVKATPKEMDELGPRSAVACPECAGPTWALGEPDNRRYRCYLGHVTNARELLAEGHVQIETALWSAVRALAERAATYETLARDSEKAGNRQSAASYDQRARDTRTQADLARQFMLDLVRER